MDVYKLSPKAFLLDWAERFEAEAQEAYAQASRYVELADEHRLHGEELSLQARIYREKAEAL